MAESVIRRIIRLILDKGSADKVKKDSQSLTGDVENAWRDAARKIATYLGAAFLIKKMVDFSRAAVDSASQAEVAWSGLQNAVEAAGESFDGMEAKLRAQSSAFQDATIHDDDSYAVSLSRLIALTGDVSASTQNMGLVANVAARFFNGDLAPATDLVAKVMNGQVTILQRMGIEVKTAQEGLEVLANRSMGAASERAATFSGRMAQLNNAWGDFLEAIGLGITQSGGATDALTILQDVVVRFTGWVDDNRQTISDWVVRGINFAIVAADVLLRAIMGLGNTLQGGFNTALGIIVKGIAFLTQGFALATSAGARFQELTGQKSAEEARKYADSVAETAQALHNWADAAIRAGSEQVKKGLEQFANPLFTPASLGAAPRRTRAELPGTGAAPAVSAGTKTEEQENIEKAMESFIRAGERISAMQSVLGDKFKATEAEIQRTTDLLVAMAENGVSPADESFQALARHLQFLTEATTESDAALIAMNERLAQDSQIAILTGVESFDMLRSQQQELARTMRTLISQGMNPQDARLKALAERYREVTETIEQQTLAMHVQAGAAGFLGEAVGAAMEGGIGPAASAKARQNRIEAVEMLVRAAGFALFGNPFAAGAALRQAAGHFALSAAWSALASSSKKPAGSSSASIPTTASGGGSPGGGITSARQSSARNTSAARSPNPEVAIYMVGPGFDAANPTVQRVVYGGYNAAQERFGNNAKVRVIRQ